MNTKTLDNTANDPWADIATADLVNYVRNTGHFPAAGYQAPKPQAGIDPWAPAKWPAGDGGAGRALSSLDRPAKRECNYHHDNSYFLNRLEQGEWRETSHWTTSCPCPNSATEGSARRSAGWGTTTPIVVMRNNKPAAIVISPDDYRRLTEAEEDFALYLEAEERMKRDDGTRLGMDDVFGKDYKPVDDGYVPEFE